jgi:hypothetical protein
MSWSGIANNQCVSFSNLQDAVTTGVFVLKSAITSTAEQITKADANTYVYIDTSYSPYSAKASNQLVVKSDLRGGFLLYGSGFGCVVPETDILIAPNITKKADGFSIGDIVYTQHESTKEWGYYKVMNLERKTQPILNITTTEGDIVCSTTHLLSRGGEFVEAKELVEGDLIQHINGEATISEIVSKEESEVIDFTIEEAHTYVAAGFMSHNKCTLLGWDDCSAACTNGTTAYSTDINYTGTLGVGTIINSPTCFLNYIKFFYYVGGYIEIEYDGSDLKVKSLGTCGSCTTTTTTSAYTTTQIDIFNNSADVPITGMEINGVAVTYLSGTNFTLVSGNSGSFTTGQLGTQTVNIYYGSNIGGQNITFEDSDSIITCHDANNGGGTFTITGATITGGINITVIASDGTCF